MPRDSDAKTSETSSTRKTITRSEGGKSTSSSKDSSSDVGSKASGGDRNPPIVLDKKDVYESVIKHESEAAVAANIDLSAQEFLETSEEFQEVLQDIYNLKLSDNFDEEELEELKTEGLLLLNKLRHLNRISKLRLKLVKDDALNHRQDVDRNHLLLQNLLYEATHLKKQVEAVQEYKGQDEEIDLIPVDKFYQVAPLKISNPEVTKVNDHYLRVARLEHEFILRQELTNSCADLEKTKDAVAFNIESSRKKLDSIRPLLHAVLESTKPVQEFFGMNVWKEQKELQTSYLLPIPLYCLFIQSCAYKDSLKPDGFEFSAKICGDIEAAREYIEDVDEDEPEEDSDSDMECDVDDIDNADSGLSGRRKPRKGNTSRAEKTSPRRKLVQTHPLWVDWTLKISSGETVIITFSYACKLQVVTVKSKIEAGVFSDRIPSLLSQADSILTELYPGDNGMECPNPATFYHLRKADVEEFSELVGEVGRPYVWAQKVSGLSFPSIIKHMQDYACLKPMAKQQRPDVKYSSMKIEKTVQNIFERLRNQSMLWSQIKALEIRDIVIPSKTRPWFPKKFASIFVSWEYYSLSHIPSMLSRCLSRNKKFNISSELKEMVFKAVVERGRVKLHAFVIIGMNFPATPPVCLLVMEKDGVEYDSSNDFAIKEMEKEINYYTVRDFPQYPEYLLVLQIYRMMYNLDVVLETDNLIGETSGPAEFGRDKVFSSLRRGRNGRRPLLYGASGSETYVLHTVDIISGFFRCLIFLIFKSSGSSSLSSCISTYSRNYHCN
ncbi:unnamed protein product [Allacma fusca]|uniref:THO complex subunit 5 n=1 Tax=Allacma fusca TaxID=39272 RepID=A0A8J2NYP4_9HEXA|nr:unnamed protein product [Allacma fusca]